MEAVVPVRMEEVTAGYGRRKVLMDLWLELPKRSVCALLGRNGAGKTTLLRLLLGFLKPHAGRVTVLGQDAWQRRFRLKDSIGFVAERQDLWPGMRGGEILALGARIHAAWDGALTTKLAKRCSLPLDERVSRYSKGMQVLLALVLALGHRPDLLLLDEPVAGLDPVMRERFAENVLDYVQETGATVLYSTHLVDEVQAMADRVAVLDGGHIVLEGPLEAIVERYARVTVMGDVPPPRAADGLDVVALHRRDGTAVVTVCGDPALAAASLGALGLTVMETRRPTLQELFVALLGEDNSHRQTPPRVWQGAFGGAA